MKKDNKAIEKGHFFNREQKEIKAKMMMDLLEVFSRYTNENSMKFKDQNLFDLLTSILIMLNRDVLLEMFINSNIKNDKYLIENILNSMFEEIKKQVLDNMKKIEVFN